MDGGNIVHLLLRSKNMTNEISFKELYEVSLKTTLPIEVGGETIEAGEVVAFFDSV
jgi:hypothetical protein